MPLTELEAGARLAIAVLVGTGVGLEREWSGQASGPNARFAGLRTFLLLGLLGGVAGLLIATAEAAAGSVVIAGGIALTVAAYVMVTRRPEADIGGTTETAALAVIALGVLAGCGMLELAAAAGSIVVLALSEKSRLHWFVRHVGERELHSTLQFAVLALVVLPILPDGPFGGPLEIRPRAVWMIALLFSGLSFAAYLLRRALGSNAGYIVTGLAGGLVSSTATTLDFSRSSVHEPAHGRALAFGVIGACTVLIPRVIIASSLLNVEVALGMARLLWLPLLVGAAATALGWRSRLPREAETSTPDGRNPLRLAAAIRMALLFQVVISAIAFVQGRWGASGVFVSASVLGLTDVDALTMSMSRLDAGVSAGIAARAICIGILANTALKFVLSAALGGGAYRRVALAGLGALGVATVVGMVIS